MKKLSMVFGILAILLSNVMCAVVAYNYSYLLFCGKYGGCSAPADAAFLSAIPFIVGVIVCVVIAILLYKKVVSKVKEHNLSSHKKTLSHYCHTKVRLKWMQICICFSLTFLL